MRFCSVWLNTMPGTKPPPSMRTFFQEYESAAAAEAEATTDVTATATVAAPAMSADAIATLRRRLLLRMNAVLKQSAVVSAELSPGAALCSRVNPPPAPGRDSHLRSRMSIVVPL